MIRIFRFSAAALTAVLTLSAAGLAAQSASLGLKTVVIDPGHGGNDPGCVSKDRKTREKDLTLDISRRLAEKIRAEYPDVKVRLTRNSDVFVPLVQRAQIANSANADLFVSIHINSIASSSPNGFSVHVLGQSSKKGRDLFSNNFNECARENSVILLEEDYTTNYQGFDPNDPESSILFSLMQNAYLEQSLMFADYVSRSLAKGKVFAAGRGVHQDPFLVLWKTAMPAVLIECGFISNASDLSVLRNKSKIDAIADCILEAFRNFKTDYDRSLSVSAPQAQAQVQTASSPRVQSASVSQVREASSPRVQTACGQETCETIYGTQILALRRLLPENAAELKGYRAIAVSDGNIYRYITGCAGTVEAAEKEQGEIRKDFPGSFLVRVENGGRVERLPSGGR